MEFNTYWKMIIDLSKQYYLWLIIAVIGIGAIAMILTLIKKKK